MNEKIEKVKKHLSENKTVYISNGVTAASLIGLYFVVNRSPRAVESLQIVKQIAFRAEANPVMINLVERSTPSKPVHLVGTNLYFDSLSDAARKTGHSMTQISHVANGKKSSIDGDVFEFLNPV